MMRAIVLAGLATVALGVPSVAHAAPSEHRLEDGEGHVVATFVVRADTASSISVPPGEYVHVKPDGTRSEVRIGPGERFVASGPTTATAPPVRALVARPEPAPGVPPPRTDRKGPVKHAWAAPLLASFLPGTGHAIARRPGAAFGWFAAAAGLTFGSVALGLSADNREGATPRDAGRSGVREALRHITRPHDREAAIGHRRNPGGAARQESALLQRSVVGRQADSSDGLTAARI